VNAGKTDKTGRVVIHTDGACSGNPGPGGWGVLLEFDGKEKELCGGEAVTTNNRMELQAAIEALSALKRSCPADLYTDSQYVQHAELWKALDEELQRHDVKWHWIKGHAGHDGNERADALARKGMAPYQR
jgi:ribonuclease HI